MASKYTNLNKNNSIIESITKFNGFYVNNYRDPFINGTAFIFITKPLLFLEPIKPASNDTNKMMAYINMTRSPLFTQYIKTEQLNEMDDAIIKSLSYNMIYSKSNFLPIFTNECKSFDSQDTLMDQYEAFDTKEGYRQVLPSSKTQSEAANNITISVTEDSNLTFTKMMNLWVNYISNITNGTFDANPEMVRDGILDYTSSIFYFVLEPDGKTLKYWAKYTGCWPTTIPYSTLSYSRGTKEPVELSLNFHYMVKEDMNPKILEDFNYISLKLQDDSELEYSIDGYYASIVSSPLLNREMLLNFKSSAAANILESSERDPIILLVNNSNSGIQTDSTDKKFELIFDDHGYESEFLKSVLDDSYDKYYLNDIGNTEYAKTGKQMNWNETEFWKEN